MLVRKIVLLKGGIMSICVALAVPDGIVLAADTQTTWSQWILKAKDKKTNQDIELAQPIQLPIGWSRMAKKLFKLSFGGVNYAVCCAGVASINQKTIYSILKSQEKSYSGDGTYSDVTGYCVEGLKKEFRKEFKAEDLSTVPINNIVQLIFASFIEGDVSQPVLENICVFTGAAKVGEEDNSSGVYKSWKNSENGIFGCCWIGESRFISHIVNHQNKDLPPIQGQYHMMTLEDAKDYVKFLVEYTCDFQRFAVMVPTCGRPIITAKLTPDNCEENVVQ